MAELHVAHIEDVPWQEVKAQEHADADGARRVSVWEKYLSWTPSMLVLYARYDAGMLIERHGHRSDHVVYVLEGSVRVGDRDCTAGTCLVLEHGATFGPLEAGSDGTVMLEIMCGDPRAVPADPAEFAALCAARGVTPLPNPPIAAPAFFGERTDT